MQAQRAAEDVGKKLPGAGDVTSAAKNAVPALPKVSISCTIKVCFLLPDWDHSACNLLRGCVCINAHAQLTRLHARDHRTTGRGG